MIVRIPEVECISIVLHHTTRRMHASSYVPLPGIMPAELTGSRVQGFLGVVTSQKSPSEHESPSAARSSFFSRGQRSFMGIRCKKQRLVANAEAMVCVCGTGRSPPVQFAIPGRLGASRSAFPQVRPRSVIELHALLCLVVALACSDCHFCKKTATVALPLHLFCWWACSPSLPMIAHAAPRNIKTFLTNYAIIASVIMALLM